MASISSTTNSSGVATTNTSGVAEPSTLGVANPPGNAPPVTDVDMEDGEISERGRNLISMAKAASNKRPADSDLHSEYCQEKYKVPLYMAQLYSRHIRHYLANIKTLASKQATYSRLVSKWAELPYTEVKIDEGQLGNDPEVKLKLPEIKAKFRKELASELQNVKYLQVQRLEAAIQPRTVIDACCQEIEKMITTRASWLVVPDESQRKKYRNDQLEILQRLRFGIDEDLADIRNQTYDVTKFIKVRNGLRYVKVSVFDRIPLHNKFEPLANLTIEGKKRRIDDQAEKQDNDRPAQDQVRAEETFLQKGRPKVYVKQRQKREKSAAKEKVKGSCSGSDYLDIATVNKIEACPLYNNLTKLCVPKDFDNLLSKGYKFIPHRPLNNEILARSALRVKSDIERHISEELGIKDKINLDTLAGVFWEDFIHDINSSKLRRPKHSHVLDKFVKWLRDNDLMVILADKNLGAVIVYRKWYDDQVMSHLNDETTYTKVDQPDPKKIDAELRSILRRHGIHDGDTRRQILPNLNSIKLPNFYILAKLHKTPVKSRPIVPSHSWITTHASQYVNDKLQPLLKNFPWVLENSIEAINKLSATHVADDELLVSLDVESLYTNIDIDLGISNVEHILWKYSDYPIEEQELLLDLMRWICNNNYFSFKGEFYRQCKGVAMGTNFAPIFANLFLAAYEEIWFRDELKPFSSWMRYLDDILAITKSTPEEVIKLVNSLNNRRLSVTYTFEMDSNSANFLDIRVFKGSQWKRRRKLDITLYEKPTNLHLFTEPTGDYPLAYRYNWIKGEMIRYVRNHSDFETFQRNVAALRGFLHRRNYNLEMVRRLTPDSLYGSRLTRLRVVKTRNPNYNNSTIVVKHHPGWENVVKFARNMLEAASGLGYPVQLKNVVLGKGKSLYNIISSKYKKDPSSVTSKRPAEDTDNDPSPASVERGWNISTLSTSTFQGSNYKIP